MKKKNALTALCCAAMLGISAAAPYMRAMNAQAATQIVFSDIAYSAFEDGSPFKGVDVSSVIALEQSGVVYRDADGNPCDIFQTLKQYGVNTVRVRIWNDPTHSESGASYGGGACDADCAVTIARRCADAGLKLLLDFHYSDFWADPAKQKVPKAWANYSHEQKQQAIYDFTAETLQKVAATGADIAMVQIGNETTGGMCGTMLADYNWSEEGWQLLGDLWNAGADAVRDFDRDVLVALHFTNPEQTGNYSYYAQMIQQSGVDYDVFATSYYPYWHGTMENLTTVMNEVAQTYDKLVMVAETSWLYTTENTDSFANTISGDGDLGEYVSYEISPEGQAACISDVFSAMKAVENGKGIGVFYWEPAWLPVGTDYATNLGKWESYGSGWASQAAQEYDPDAQYYGGSAVDNQALFDANGVPLSSLSVFQTVRGSRVVNDPDNLLENPGFDRQEGWTDAPDGWTLNGTADGHFDVREEDAMDGTCALHWYSDTAFSDSRAETQHTAAMEGAYCFSVKLQGDAASAYTLEITVNGTVSETRTGSLNGWNQWQTVSVSANAKAGDNITIRLSVSGEAGSFGSADACTLYYSEIAETTTTTTATTTTTTTEETTLPHVHMMPGDVNCDGSLGIEDVILLNRFLAEDDAISLSEQGLRHADANLDDKVNGEDSVAMLRMIAGLTRDTLRNMQEDFVRFW